MRRYLAFLLISLASVPTMAAQMWTAQGACDGGLCGPGGLTGGFPVDFKFILLLDDATLGQPVVSDPNVFQSFQIIIDPDEVFGPGAFDAYQPPISYGTDEGVFVQPGFSDSFGALSLSGSNGHFCADPSGLLGTTTACIGISGPTGLSGASDIGGSAWLATNDLGMAIGSTPLTWFYGGQVADVVVPVPAAAWLFASALIGLAGIKRRQ